MTDDTTPRVLQTIQSTLIGLDRKLGTLAESVVRNSARIDSLAEGIHGLSTEVHGLRTDIHTVAMAIDEHGHRLAALEEGFQAVRAELSRIMRPQ